MSVGGASANGSDGGGGDESSPARTEGSVAAGAEVGGRTRARNLRSWGAAVMVGSTRSASYLEVSHVVSLASGSRSEM